MSNANKWGTLQEELIQVLIENEDKPKGIKKTNKQLFKDFAEINNTTEASTSFHYYNHIKPNFKSKTKALGLDEKVEKLIKETSLAPSESIRGYKVGDVVEVTIHSIVDFGAFATTDDGMEGLIHISQITGREFVAIPDEFFFEGERVKVKILKLDRDKVSFSTRAVGGKEKVSPTFNGLGKALSKIELDKHVETIKPKAINPVVPKPVVVTPEPVAVAPVISETEKDHVIQFIKSFSGNNISTKALKEVENLLNQYPVFKITLALVETVRDLDISSFIVELTKERLSGERLRRANKREDFSDSSFLRKVE
jgi:predicted RNA-binding protein with RPS1 domain